MALISINKLEELTGKQRKTIVRRLSNTQPHDKKGTANLYDSTVAFELIYLGAGQNGKKLDLKDERARLAKAQADAQELKNKITENETAPLEILETALLDVCNQIKSTLESIPLKVKQRLPFLTATEIEIITKEVVKAQNAASEIRLSTESKP